MIPILDSLIGGVIKTGGDLIKSYFPPDLSPEQKAKLEAGIQAYQLEMNKELNEYSKTVIQEQSKIIQAEAKSDSYLAKNWRPITMLVFVFIIANNYIFFPYISLFGGSATALPIPPDMWQLLKLGLSGYIIGRSAEKVMKHYKGVK